jgi:hypothetical protein
LAVVLSQVGGKQPLIGCWVITGRKPSDSDCSPIYYVWSSFLSPERCRRKNAGTAFSGLVSIKPDNFYI